MADRVSQYLDNEVTTTQAFNRRVDETNAAFVEVDAAIEALAGSGSGDGEVPALKARVKGLEDRADALEPRVTTLETKTAQQGKDIASNAAGITALQDENADQGAQLGRHETAITGLQDDLAAHEADAVAHVTAAERQSWGGKASARTLGPLTLTAAGWTGDGPYTQQVAVSGVTAADKPIGMSQVFSGTAAEQQEQYIMAGFVGIIETLAGAIKCTCMLAKPEIDLIINVEVLR